MSTNAVWFSAYDEQTSALTEARAYQLSAWVSLGKALALALGATSLLVTILLGSRQPSTAVAWPRHGAGASAASKLDAQVPGQALAHREPLASAPGLGQVSASRTPTQEERDGVSSTFVAEADQVQPSVMQEAADSQIDEDDPAVLNTKFAREALIAQEQGRYEDALALREQVVASCPYDSDCKPQRLALIAAYYAAGRRLEATKLAQDLETEFAEDPTMPRLVREMQNSPRDFSTLRPDGTTSQKVSRSSKDIE